MSVEAGKIIRIWRKRRELSQSDVAAKSGISTRHQSYIENGRTNASAQALRSIAKTLWMPESDKNLLLLAAGFAPDERIRKTSDHEVHRARELAEWEITSHMPYPAFAADECWNLIEKNPSMKRMLDRLNLSGVQAEYDSKNFAHLVFHPAGLRKIIDNWHNFSAFFMRTMRQDSLRLPVGHEFHKLIEHVHPWSEDQDGADILEPYALSAIAMPVTINSGKSGIHHMRFTVFRFSATSSSPAAGIRIVKFYPSEKCSEK